MQTWQERTNYEKKSGNGSFEKPKSVNRDENLGMTNNLTWCRRCVGLD